MDDTGTVRHGNVAVAGYEMSFLVLLLCCLPCTGKKRLILFILQLLSLIGLQDLISRCFFRLKPSKHGIQKRLCQIIGITVCRLHLAIGLIRVHAQRHIGRKCPRGCGPCQKISIFSLHLETHYCRAFLDRLISLGHLMRRKRGSASWTVGNDLKALIQKSLIPDLL